jgi:hypothetical protein
MATFTKIKNGWLVSVSNEHFRFETEFKDKKTAELYAFYREDLFDKMKKFDAPLKDVVSLIGAIDFKIIAMKDNQRDKKTIEDIIGLTKCFPEWLELPLSELTYEMMLKKADEMFKEKVRRGGSQKTEGSGKIVIQSPVTVRKKFACLSSVISHMISQGVQCENNAYKILGYLQSVINESKDKNV